MGKIYFQPDLSDQVEREFRKKANARYEDKKGAFNNTIIDLIEAFVNGDIELSPIEK